MNEMRANTLNELQKWFAKRGSKLMLLLVAAAPMLVSTVFYFIEKNGLFSIPDTNIQFMTLNLFTAVILPIFIIMAATDFFTGELENKTIKLLFMRPISRGEIFASKSIAIALLCSLQLILVGSVAVLITTIMGNREYILVSLIAYTVSIFPLIAFTALSVFLVQWFKSSTAAAAILITLYALMKAAVFFFPQSMYALPAAYSDWYLRWIGHPSLLWISQSFVYLISFTALFFTLGYYMFNKKEI